MGGFFNRVDLKQRKMARKIGRQNRNHGGLEAPRNSLDLPLGTYRGYYTPHDDGLVRSRKYQETHDWIERSCYPTEVPMKKLISDEISKRPKSRSNSPSIVARLMGVDTVPLDAKPLEQRAEKKHENTHLDLSKEKLSRSSSVGSAVSPSKSFRQTSLDSLQLSEESDVDEWSGRKMTKKPLPREHPQEEELQKFKKEFEAWQAARFRECSKIVEHDDAITISDQWMAQENLNKQKKAIYSNSQTNVDRYQDLRKCRSLKAADSNEFLSVHESRKTLSQDSEPIRIVILKPGFDDISNPEEPFASSSGAFEDRNNIQDFLEEVKERLKFELQGKTFNTGGLIRGSGIETPYSERSSDPKQIAQRIAKQVRESVTKDLGTSLLRSESTRSYKNEFRTSSPEFISRDTRKLLSERLRNVLKTEPHKDLSTDEVEKDENDTQSKSFRCGPDDMDMILQRNLSPINLVRSLSAPVSGTSFGKLLLEDRHVVTGAHIRRKHEVNEKLTMKAKKHRKDKFNLKERVSSLKYNLTLRTRLFGRKIHSASEFRENDRSFVKDIMNGPTVMMNIADRPENATEVPPSPASVCSSVHEDLHRAALCASPSTPGAPTSDGNDLPQAFRDISSNLNELRKQLHQLETGQLDEAVTEEEKPPHESEMADLKDEDEAYIQDLLFASGLYDNSFHNSLSRWDSFAKPISSRIFDQVKELHQYNDHKSVHHKVLLDLVNEVLSTVLAPRRKAGRLPRGNTLLDQIWGILRAFLHPNVDKSFYVFDSMVARDLDRMPWSDMVNEDIDALAKEVETLILRDLMEETVLEMRHGY